MLINLHKLKLIFARFLYYSRITHQYIYSKTNNKAIILAYHRTIPKNKLDSKTQMSGMYVSEETFKMHMAFSKKFFDFISLDMLIKYINTGKKWERPLCAVTFDDGWEDNYYYAFPTLHSQNIPATIFLIGKGIDKYMPLCWHINFEIFIKSKNCCPQFTNNCQLDTFISKTKEVVPTERARQFNNIMRSLHYNDFLKAFRNIFEYFSENFNLDEFNNKYKTLSEQQIVSMSSAGIDFGYHTLNHFMLSKIPSFQLRHELAIPGIYMDSKTINFKKIFCYPDGNYTDNVINVLRDYNYSGAVTLKNGVNDHKTNTFKLRRINIHEEMGYDIPLFLYNIMLRL